MYGEAANLNPNAIKAVSKYSRGIGISLKGKSEVELFLFSIETYLSVFMKLLITAIASQRKLISAANIQAVLGHDPLGSLVALAKKIPFLRESFEHDVFSWFIESAKHDRTAENILSDFIKTLALTLDRVDLTKVRADLLRRSYQEFFDPETRKALGEFYTDEGLVEEVLDSVDYSGDKILDKVLLDPSCGSGTFLMGAIHRYIEAAKAKFTSAEIVKQITQRIVGIDVHPFAVTMARVNYILALTPLLDENVRQQLRELAIPIYWTDSLATHTVEMDSEMVVTVKVNVAPLGSFILPDPSKVAWDHLMNKVKHAVDSGWAEERFLQEFPEDTTLIYRKTLSDFFSIFKERAGKGKDGKWLSTLRNVTVVDSLRNRCDYVVGNPPWVRFENIDSELRERIGQHFKFFGKEASWKHQLKKIKTALDRHVDYSLAFVEAAFNYLRDSGYFGFIITSNVIRSLYAGRMRNMMIRETKILRIKDYSLTKIHLFEGALNAPLIVSCLKEKPDSKHRVKVEMVNRLNKRLKWTIAQKELPLRRRDPSSPMMIAPPKIIKAIRKMQKQCTELGQIFRISEGIATAANNVFFLKSMKPTDDKKKVAIESNCGDKLRIEKEIVSPVIRGRDIDAWTLRIESYMLLPHKETGEVLSSLPVQASRYFESHKTELLDRKRWQIAGAMQSGAPYWIAANPSKLSLSGKVGWQKIAKTIEAAHIPLMTKHPILGKRPLVVDSSLSFIMTDDKKIGKALTAILNSLPARVFASTFVNRTGGAYCQYFGWVMGLIPIPNILSHFPKELSEIKSEEDEILGEKILREIYGLKVDDIKAMRDFHEDFSIG